MNIVCRFKSILHTSYIFTHYFDLLFTCINPPTAMYFISHGNVFTARDDYNIILFYLKSSYNKIKFYYILLNTYWCLQKKYYIKII